MSEKAMTQSTTQSMPQSTSQPTAKLIFVNLPVADLSKAFYEAVGFRNKPQFTDDIAAMTAMGKDAA